MAKPKKVRTAEADTPDAGVIAGAEDISALLNRVKKRLGNAVVVTQLSDVVTPYHKRFPFGLMNLDTDIAGGLPGGTINQIFGQDGTGKNLLVNMLLAQTQQTLGSKANILYVSFGYLPDIPFMRKCGVKVRKTAPELTELGIDPATATAEQLGEQVGNVVFINVADNALAREQPAEVIFEGVREILESCQFHLIIIDEMASGETKDDVKKGLEEHAKVASWSGLVAQFVKKVYSALRRVDEDGAPNATCIIVLQPVRANMDPNSAVFNPFTQPSGHSLKHAKAIDLHISHAGYINKAGVKVGKKIKYKIAKGKFGVGEGAEGQLEFYFFDKAGKGGIDPLPILANMAKIAGTVIQRGVYYYILDYEDRIEGGLDPGVIDVLRGSSAEFISELTVATAKALQTGEVG